MRCGVLHDKDGAVIRTWALVNDTVSYDPVNAGDEVIEWETDHGDNEPNHARRDEKIVRATEEQERIKTFRHKDDALQHNWERARLIKVRGKKI